MKILLDSNIIIYASMPLHGTLRQKLFNLNGQYGVSAISVIEVLGYHLLTHLDKQEIETFFENTIVYPIDDLVVKKAVEIRQNLKISLGDSIIAATCIHFGLELWTNNTSDFKSISDLSIYNPMTI